MEWDEMEGVFAVAVYGRIKVGRVTDDGYEELWTYQTLGVSFFLYGLQPDALGIRFSLGEELMSRKITIT